MASFPRIIGALATMAIVLARPPPETCDPAAIQECLSRFETRFSECDQDDLHCQCISIITNGANCYAACPQDAMTMFIKTYNEGKCATYDPYMSRRSDVNSNVKELSDTEESRIFNEWLGIDSKMQQSKLEPRADDKKTRENINEGMADSINAKQEVAKESIKVDAITITPSDPTTTISLSPQEYQSRLEKSRYKENLRSIRHERARLSSEQAARLAMPTSVNQKEAKESRSSSEVTGTADMPSKAKHTESKIDAGEVKQKSGANMNKLSSWMIGAILFAAFI